MGAVYLVTDSRLGGKKCALKEMSDISVTDPVELNQAKEAFQREAEMLSSLSHPVLPRVTDFFTLVNKHYLVMDFADGRPLDEILEKRTRPFPVSQVICWADQLCDVLIYLHSQKPPVIYRDIKPGNIMLSPDRMQVKLIDFGIARTYKLKQSRDTIAIGTPGYAPPEQYGKVQTDQRSDIYALGATLHHLLTLRDPGDDPFKFPQVIRLNPRVSANVNQVIMKSIEQDREKRWQSAKEMAQALETEPALSKTNPPLPQVPQSLPFNPTPSPSGSGNIPSTPLSSLATSFLSQSRFATLKTDPSLRDRIKKVRNDLKNIQISFSSPINFRKSAWRGYLWVVLACVVAVLISLYLDDVNILASWGYWGKILGGIILPLPFLFSAVYVKRIGAAGLPVMFAGLCDSGFLIYPLITALSVELPFLLMGYKHYRYPLLFISTLLFGIGKYLNSYHGDVFFAFEEIMITWMVAFLSPLIVFTIARLTNRL